MKRREIAAGIVLLTVLAAGAWWARLPSPAAVTAPVAKGASANPADDEGLPDATAADVSAADGDVRVYLSLRPKPPVAFARFRARVGVAREVAPPPADAVGSMLATALDLQDARISFEMEMPMGDHRYSLVPGEEGWLEAAVVLPTCPSGKRRWYATVEGTVAGRPVKARFRLDLAPSG